MYNPRARRLLSLQAPEPVTCAAPQVDGTAVLLTGVASGAIHVWQVNTAAQLTDTTVKLWDPRGRDAVATLKGQGGAITHVQHSPDGLLVVSGSTEGLIQVRAVAFPSDGRAVLGASVDGLRTYSWEPSETYDMVDIPWAKVSELTYCDGKAFGLAFINCMVDMWTVDLTQVRPFGEPRRPSSCLDRRRLSPAAHFVAERRRQLKTAVTKPVAPTQESLVAPGLRAVPAQRDCPIRAASAADVRALLRARSQQLREIRGLLARGDMRGSFHAIKAYQDLAITMQVVSKWAALPDPPLELCIEAAALCENLLSSSEAVNQDTGLQMVSRMLRREQLQTLLPALNKLTATRNSQASQLVTTILTL
ncbi:hypothetical protein N2152v2_007067 [Parachlorella kessleri]